MVTGGGGGGAGRRVEGPGYSATEGGLTLGGEHRMQRTEDVLVNSTLETCVIPFASVTSIDLI